MFDFEYHSPGTLEEASRLLKEHDGRALLLAGGTDLLPNIYNQKLSPEHVINIKRIPLLNSITCDESQSLALGTLVKFNEIIYSKTVQENFPVLAEVSKGIASHQIRNLATIGGNLCNAAPSADSAPILVALDSSLTITGPGGKVRSLPLEQFFTGPGETELAPAEILTQIRIPPLKKYTGMIYIKYSTRRALEIAVVGVAALIQLEKDTDKCCAARIVIAACAPTPLRVYEAEEILTGKKISDRDLDASSQAAGRAVKPITDVRAGDTYRREMVRVQCKRALKEALSRAQSGKAVENKE
jgi:carbon-monoxide dehydrogenase medium subunit